MARQSRSSLAKILGDKMPHRVGFVNCFITRLALDTRQHRQEGRDTNGSLRKLLTKPYVQGILSLSMYSGFE